MNLPGSKSTLEDRFTRFTEELPNWENIDIPKGTTLDVGVHARVSESPFHHSRKAT